MNHNCAYFLQWALPKLEMQWSGFRKVRRQVCKRVQKRMCQLEIPDWKVYQQYLINTPHEWKHLDSLFYITISRFYRDRFLFEYLEEVVLPKLLHSFPETSSLNSISLGCASGEEPYTLAILWKERISRQFPERSVKIWGLDIDPVVLQRAKKGIYPSSSLRDLPVNWKEQAFLEKNGLFTLSNKYKKMVEFFQADIRVFEFKAPYHLVGCRNLVAFYFSKKLQIETFQKIRHAMPEGAVLLLGAHEKLPVEVEGFQPDTAVRQIYWAI